MLNDARDESEKILAKGRKDLNAETDRLKEELKTHVTDLSLVMAEKILKKSVDGKLRDEVFKDSLEELSGRRS
jgi:F0F1-type ATP synthase membrane subunit b/b'